LCFPKELERKRIAAKLLKRATRTHAQGYTDVVITAAVKTRTEATIPPDRWIDSDSSFRLSSERR
jgi:hypothetical protein